MSFQTIAQLGLHFKKIERYFHILLGFSFIKYQFWYPASPSKSYHKRSFLQQKSCLRSTWAALSLSDWSTESLILKAKKVRVVGVLSRCSVLQGLRMGGQPGWDISSLGQVKESVSHCVGGRCGVPRKSFFFSSKSVCNCKLPQLSFLCEFGT